MPGQEDVVNQVANGGDPQSSQNNSNNPSSSNYVTNEQYQKMVLQHLNNIYQAVSRNGMSQSAARDFIDDATSYDPYQRPTRRGHFGREYDRRTSRSFYDSSSFIDAFEKSIVDEILGDEFKKQLKDIGKNFATELGLDLNNLSGSVGKKLGKFSITVFKETDLGKKVSSYIDKVKGNLVSQLNKKSQNIVSKLKDENFTKNASKAVNDYINKYKDMGGTFRSIPRMSSTMIADTFRAIGKGVEGTRSFLRDVFNVQSSTHPDPNDSTSTRSNSDRVQTEQDRAQTEQDRVRQASQPQSSVPSNHSTGDHSTEDHSTSPDEGVRTSNQSSSFTSADNYTSSPSGDVQSKVDAANRSSINLDNDQDNQNSPQLNTQQIQDAVNNAMNSQPRPESTSSADVHAASQNAASSQDAVQVADQTASSSSSVTNATRATSSSANSAVVSEVAPTAASGAADAAGAASGVADVAEAASSAAEAAEAASSAAGAVSSAAGSGGVVSAAGSGGASAASGALAGAGSASAGGALTGAAGGAGAEGALAGAGAAGAGSAGAGAAGSAAAGAAAGGLGAALVAAAPYVLAILVALKAFQKILESVNLTLKAIGTLIDTFKKAANRDKASREKNLQFAKERMIDDYETLVKQPFELLRDAAKSVYDTWNSDLKVISATQGYSKSDVQDLMSVYAARLRSEGLSSYINSADLTDNLTKVLKSGMSGAIAEEFSYQATKLNAAIPTQDFFDYGATYASVAANAVQAGKSQSDAIEIANQSLFSFASGLLYASRELTGGFTTGLQNASSTYEQAVKISQAARTDNVSDIAGVLLATQGYLGAVAPDLATSIADTIYKALTGGNSADIVALRSLAGVNASNTEFLRAFAQNPQKIFVQLFENLSKMYTDSSDAYMEKAEGYSQLFGLTSEAFQRIDFNGLANAIARMNMSDSSLNENMKLLVSGQSTTNAEQLKAQQINKYMIEEGLSYVIDNQAAQLIQEHMWNEQEKRELMEAKYSVELKGSALEILEMLKNAVNNILNFLNPFSWLKKIANVISTAAEAEAQEADVRTLLELGKVGQGNAKDLYNLTTRNADLRLTQSLVEMMGGTSAYRTVSQYTKVWNTLGNLPIAAMDGVELLANGIRANIENTVSSRSDIMSTLLPSNYEWGQISKSESRIAAALLEASKNTTMPAAAQLSVAAPSGTSVASNSAAAVKTSIDKMLADEYLVDKFVKEGKSYEDWAATSAKYGISDIQKAIEDAGYSEEDIRKHFQDKETEQGVEETNAIRLHEKLFRQTGIQFWSADFPDDFRDPLFEYFEEANSHLRDIYNQQLDWKSYFKSEWINKGWPAFVATSGSGLFNKFYSEFMKRFITNYYYNNTSGYTYSDVEAIQRKSKQQENGDTVYALAEMLTKNLVDLKDPTVQTNALLSQILIVVNAIMNQQNEVASTTGASQILDSFSAMALGLTTSST